MGVTTDYLLTGIRSTEETIRNMGAKQGKRGWGVKIKNPLPLMVRVNIRCETGALRIGDGKETWRTIPPGEELYLSTKGQCELDITTTIVRFDPAGKQIEVGPAELRQTHHQAPTAGGDIEVTAKLNLRQEAGLGTVSGKSAEVTDGEPIREGIVTVEIDSAGNITDPPPEEVEVPIRTLGDQIADLRKQEVSV